MFLYFYYSFKLSRLMSAPVGDSAIGKYTF